MSPTHNRRRFIAGAVCPRCGEMDKLLVDLETDQRECVACGFSEARPGTESPGSQGPAVHSSASQVEMSTRVNRPVARRVETVAEPVRLINPEEE
jgi:uncharacterized metal-binding protein (TIGR02443 family)